MEQVRIDTRHMPEAERFFRDFRKLGRDRQNYLLGVIDGTNAEIARRNTVETRPSV